ncbi:endonuclease [Bacillus mesophilum]|uniref:Endonuclease/exonuclease/phosphatase n=1 Tax=Bacillus mesophilum TaxID=1071718 RepID=A0A7V7RLF8_9BACI|nr:endonuclease [Bacillus mesophilum]KAB2332575.1 endonuclease/exonuclease/phosphatase [Bacillus mesophilum]
MGTKYIRSKVNALLASALLVSAAVPALPISAKAETVATDLIISEYIEGGGYNKAVELYNGTGEAVDLSQYTLKLYSNGNTTTTTSEKLSSTLENGATYVIYNDHNQISADLKSKGDLASGAVNFNGDDALELVKDSEVIDSFGQVGVKSNYGTDVTLVRKSNILSGDKISTDSFDAATEWNTNPKDDFSNLGTHEMAGGDVNPPVDPDPDPDPDPGQPDDPATISIGEARELTVGETVTIKGVVAGDLKNTFSVQDETGGIAVRPTSLDLALGDEVILTGTLADYRGLLQLDGATIVEKNAGEAPAPKVVTGAEVNEENESKLVTVKDVELTSVNSNSGWANYTANDGTSFIVRDETGTLDLTVGTTYESITGILQQFDDDYQIIPRSQEDIVADSTILKEAVASPGTGTYVDRAEVTLSTTTADAEIFYTVDGTTPTDASTKYEAPIEITEDTDLKAIVKSATGEFSEVTTYEYTITDAIQIHDLQGEGHNSPFINETVSGIQGIVTNTFTLSGSYYYTIQTPDELADENPNTSEGILLYSGTRDWPVEVGDLVSVTGKVSEYAYDGYSDRQTTDLKSTQINVRNDQGGVVEVLDENVELPEPIKLDESKIDFDHIDSDQFGTFNPEVDAIDFWESIESMRVELDTVKAVAPQEHGDLITVLESEETNSLHGGVLYEEGNANPNRIHFRMEPNGAARDFEVATGDKFEGPITGVVGYSYQNYKIYVPLNEMEAAHQEGTVVPEKTKIVKDDAKLTVASYNLENFSNNRSSSSDDKARKLARAIGTDMETPDIVGVTEVQDNNGQSAGNSAANESYERLIAAIEAESGVTYEYANIDPVNNQDGGAPDANIRVGFLYNPERVQMKEGKPAGDATTAVGYEDGSLTLNPGRIDPNNAAFDDSRKPLAAEFVFDGEDVIVIANHWNSKSGDTPLFGAVQPPVYDSEIQRKQIANVIYDFIEDVKTKNPSANIVSLGDFNDYQFADALKIHEGELMTNMINEVEASDRYTYLYQGNSQVLDHILVSNNLAANTEVDILHINADFTDMAGRASDHDPVMVQIDLKNQDEEQPGLEPIEAEKEYNFKNFKTSKLTITKPSVSLTLDAASVIKNGIFFTGEYAEFHGEGFQTNDVTINPAKAGAIVDFKGNGVQKLIIDGTNVSEIRGADNLDIESIEYINGADPEQIDFYNLEGDLIQGPSFPLPSENHAPVVSKEITNKTVAAGETITIDLSEHFSDQDEDQLTFTSTKGDVNKNTLTLELEEGTHLVAVTATDGEKSVTERFTVTVTAANDENSGYYQAAIGKEGQALKSALHDIISEQKVLSYSQVWEALRVTDEHPDSPNDVLLFYSGEARSKSSNGGMVGDWNREHVWAKSHGNFGTSNGPGTDIHHLRPTDVQVNSSRGNLDFDNGGNPVKNCDDCKRSSNSFEPPDRVKGDVARMLFYMATRYEAGDRVDLELNERLNNGSAPYHGKLSVLLEWHKQDPVDEIEQRRNDKIHEIQGNRNPFIDHPEWAESIWN